MNGRRRFITGFLGASASTAIIHGNTREVQAAGVRSPLLNVRDVGAIGDGITLETQALQRAINWCVKSGGGTVFFPAGTYLSGTLILRSRVTLHFEPGATLLGSRSLEDYPPQIPAIRSYTDHYTERSLIYGENLQEVTLQGPGVLDGQGSAFKGEYKVRPYLIRLVGCREVTVRDLTMKDSPMWVQHYLACSEVLLDGLSVHSRCNANNDGIDIDGCERVRIANCEVSSGDDAIVLKSTLERSCRNVTITNCVLSSDCNAFKLGTESNGGFENIVLSNCTMLDTRLAGIALETVDGGTLERISLSNIVMRNVNGPVFMRLGNRARPYKADMPPPAIGAFRQVRISQLQAIGADPIGCSVTGLPGRPIEDVALENIRIRFAGGGKAPDSRQPMPEHPEKYPEYRMFGPLPAYGFYCRHVSGLRFRDIDIDCAAPDARPSLICEDVQNLDLFGWRATTASSSEAVIRLNEVQDAMIHGCRSPRQIAAFLAIDGRTSARIHLLANELSGATKPVLVGRTANRKSYRTD